YSRSSQGIDFRRAAAPEAALRPRAFRSRVTAVTCNNARRAGIMFAVVATNPKGVPRTFFRVGESVPASGIYRVFHPDHRLSHEVTLLKGDAFPVCEECGHDVHFELLHAAPSLDETRNFRIHLYQVPHPEK